MENKWIVNYKLYKWCKINLCLDINEINSSECISR